jgi:enoyl-CoA hydratase/carnithine racemase
VSEGATVEAGQALACGLASRLVDPPQTQDDWRRGACGPAPLIDRDTLAMIRAASRSTGGPGGDMLADADLAALVRSASASKAGPGLRERIAAYRDRTRAAR